MYATWLAIVYPEHWKEIESMARKRNRSEIDMEAVLENFGGLEGVVRHYGLKKIIRQAAPQQLVDEDVAKEFKTKSAWMGGWRSCRWKNAVRC